MKICTFALAALFTLGCADNDSGELACVQNETQACLCAGGVAGAQACDAYGIWSVCDCGDPNNMPSNNVGDTTQTPATGSDNTSNNEYAGSNNQTTPATNNETTRQLDGDLLYQSNCAVCHGSSGRGTAAGDDIREDVEEESARELVEVILEGDDDMPPIPVTEEEAYAIVRWMKLTFVH